MKRIMYLGLVIVIAVIGGCSKVKQLANINIDIPYTAQISVPEFAGDTAAIGLPPGGVSLPFPAIPVITNSQQYVAQYKTSTDKIVSFDLTKMQVQITAPNGQNFDFMDSIAIYISANTQPEILVAYQYTISKGQTTLVLNITPNLNLKNYFIQDTMYFSINTHVNAIPASGTQLNISSSFHLLANPLD